MERLDTFADVYEELVLNILMEQLPLQRSFTAHMHISISIHLMRSQEQAGSNLDVLVASL